MSPLWSQAYITSSPFDTDGAHAAFLLSLADAELPNPLHRLPICRFFNNWITAIIDLHPLCSRQMKGEPPSSLQYQLGPYDRLKWTPANDELIRETPFPALVLTFPGKSVAAIRDRIRKLRPHRPDDDEPALMPTAPA
jgi:hypothetical protein